MLISDPAVQAADGREALAAAEAAELARRAADLVLPPPVLDGWSSLCALEYGLAVHALRDRLAHAVELLRSAGAAP